MNALFTPCFALIGLGSWEIVLIFAVLLTMLAVVGLVVFLAIRFGGQRHAPPQPNPSALPAGSKCQRCGSSVPGDVAQGLCPRCVFEIGMGTQMAEAPRGEKAKAPLPEELASHFPQFEILELLGQGGMGAVYKARQKDLDRVVALKVLPADGGRDPAFAERFTREARAMAKLSHPSIVTVHEFGQAGGFYFFVMEFVDGANLRQTLQAQRLSPREAMAIVPQICEALQYAHDQGIVHRDIKPENVLLDKQGRVKIADFGLAKLLGKDPLGARLTRSAEVMGTPHYMAPEQLEKPLEVDHRADIYSLGVVFYEMLTGELPLGRFAPPSRKVQMDVRLDDVVLRALEKEPELRYQQASQFRTQVETIASGSTSQPAFAGTAPRSLGKRLVIAAGVAQAVFLITIVAMSVIAYGRPKTYVSTAMVILSFQGGTMAQQVGDFLPAEIDRLLSSPVLNQVASNLDLKQRWSRKLGTELDEGRVISLLREHITVQSVSRTTILTIRCSAGSPEEATEIAHQVAEVFCATAGAVKASVMQRATPSQVRSPNMKLVLVLLVGVAPLLALLSGTIAFTFVTRRSRAGLPVMAQSRSGSSGVVWVLSAMGVVLGIVFVALVTGAISLALYLHAQAQGREAVMRQIQLGQQADMIHKAQEAGTSARRDDLLLRLKEARRNGLTDSHPTVVALKAEIAGLDAAATNNAAGTTNIVPSPER